MGLIPAIKLLEFGFLKPFLKSIEKLIITENEHSDIRFLGERGVLDVTEIEDMIKADRIEIMDSSLKEKIDSTRPKWILSEDDFSRVRMRDKDVNFLSLPDIIWYMTRKQAITIEQAKEALDQLEMEGWYRKEAIEYVKKNLNRRIDPFIGEKRILFMRLAKEYDRLQISLASAASQLDVTTIEFLWHFTSSGYTLKYSAQDFKNAQSFLYEYLGSDYPPKS